MDQVKQIRRLLVPLDGSAQAQTVVRAVIVIARAFDAQALLIHVLERNPAASIHGEKHLTDGAEASDYLLKVAAELKQSGVRVETHVHETREGDIPLSIVQHAEEYSPDLIVLCAHGKHGLKSIVTGRIGQQVLLRGTCPVLILQPQKEPFAVKTVVVPVDSAHSHEPTLDFAASLALGFGADLHLVSVVPTLATLDLERSRTGLLLPSAMRAILDMDQESEAEQIEALVQRCRERGVNASGQVLRGNTVGEVLRRTNQIESGLVVMTTHGNIGLEALIAGSVAPRIAAKIKVPLLLLREQ
jgi:nucleotide-binding universal stress UspA family protein